MMSLVLHRAGDVCVVPSLIGFGNVKMAVAHRQLDDLPPMMFIKDAPNSHGFVAPQVIEQKWKDHFSYPYREEKDGFFLPLTIHPDVSGCPLEYIPLTKGPLRRMPIDLLGPWAHARRPAHA